MIEKLVINKAKSLGFIYQFSEEDRWKILPKHPHETWQLTEVDSRWILSVKNVPQLSLNPEEAIAFLAMRAKIF